MRVECVWSFGKGALVRLPSEQNDVETRDRRTEKLGALVEQEHAGVEGEIIPRLVWLVPSTKKDRVAIDQPWPPEMLVQIERAPPKYLGLWFSGRTPASLIKGGAGKPGD